MNIEQMAPLGPPTTAYDHVRATLRSAILTGAVTAGTRLVQAQIADQLHVSTTPVREALRDLAKEGLVIFDTHRGATVRSLNIDEVREIYELRMHLEPIMVSRTIRKLDEVHLEKAESLWQAMETGCEISEWVDLNRRFHSVFAEPDQDSRLARILVELRDSAAVYVAISLAAQPDQMKSANCDHRELIHHYRVRDKSAASKLTRDHLRSTLAIIENANQLGILSAGTTG